MKAHSMPTCILVSLCIFFFANLTMIGQTGSLQERTTVDAFQAWLRSTAIPIGDLEKSAKIGDLKALKSLIGSARVVAFGEPFHGSHEPLAFRNRLIEYLIREMGFTTVAIETALSPSKAIDDYVRTGVGDPQSFLPTVMSYGFGDYAENLELIRWICAYNQNQPAARQVRVSGIDLTGSWRLDAGRSLQALLTYLDRVDKETLALFRPRLSPFLGAFSLAGFLTLSGEQKDWLSIAITDLLALLERRRTQYIRSSSQDDYDWAVMQARNAMQDNVFLRAVPKGWNIANSPNPRPPMVESVEFRDLAMAENVCQLVKDRRPNERVVFFAHNYHVKNHCLAGVGDHPQRLSNGALTAGAYLRSMFGRDLVIIGTLFGTAPNKIGDQVLPYPVAEQGGIEELFGKAGMPCYLVDLRRIPGNGPLLRVLSAPYRMRSFNIADQYEEVPLATAFDVVLYLDHVTPYHPLPSAAK